MPSDIKACIFELDDSIVRSSAIWAAALQATVEEIGKLWSPDVALATKGMGVASVVGVLMKRYQPTISRADLHALFREHLNRCFSGSEISLCDGALDLLQHVGRERKLFVTSGIPSDAIRHVLQVTGIAECFAGCVSGEEVQREKPYPDIFLLAASRLDVDPGSCLVFGGSESGAQAAVAAGMPCAVAAAHDDFLFPEGVVVVGSWKDLIPPASQPADAPFGMPTHDFVTTFPCVSCITETSFDVRWGVSTLCTGKVEIKVDGNPGGQFFAYDGHGFIPQSDTCILVPVRGLAAGTELSFRVLTAKYDAPDEVHASEWEQLQLLRRDCSCVRFAVWNDTHDVPAVCRNLDKFTPRDLDFLVWNGDSCADRWDDTSSFTRTLIGFHECHFTRGRPHFFVPGNHDHRGMCARWKQGILGVPGGRTYHSLRCGPLACIFLDTGEDKADDHPSFKGLVAFEELRREQSKWLERTIRKPEMADAPYKIVFCHIPLRWREETGYDYDRSSKRSRIYWHQHLLDWKAQLIISGHTHEPAFLPADDEFPYAQITGGGSGLGENCYLVCQADEEQIRLRQYTTADQQLLWEGSLSSEKKNRPGKGDF